MLQSIGFLDFLGQEELAPHGTGRLYREPMDIHAWVKAARTHKGWTQGELGERLGVVKQNVSAWENGHHEPSIGQMLAISEATGYAIPACRPPGLHMPLVSADEYEALSHDGQVFVQGAVVNAIATWRSMKASEKQRAAGGT
jgi:transcriptional regulator with XRE-family HTH domain